MVGPVFVTPRVAALLVVAAATLAPVELAVARAWGEPYPAVFQPKFRGSPERAGTVRLDVPRVYAVVDGTEREVRPETLLPHGTQVLPIAVVDHIFPVHQRAKAPDDRTVRWLLRNVTTNVGHGEVSSVRVVWTQQFLDVSTGRTRWGAEKAWYQVDGR